MEKQELQKVHTEAVSFDNSKSLPLRYADRKVLEFVNERIAKKEPVTTENLRMYPLRSGNNSMVGWIFLHEEIKFEDVEATIHWQFKASLKELINNSPPQNP